MTITPFTDQAIIVELFGLNYSLPKPGSSSDTPEALTVVVERVKKFGVTKIYKPNVPKIFNSKINLDTKNYLTWGQVNGTVLQGAPEAEGFVVKPGEAGIIRSADCASVICFCPNGKDNPVIAFHTGLRSILPEAKNQKGVVDNAITTALKFGSKEKDLEVFIGPTIDPKHFIYSFADPHYGFKNKILIKEVLAHWGKNCLVGKPEEGHINLQQMIFNRFSQLGVPSKQIQTYAGDTYGDLDEQGNYRWASHVREGNDQKFTNITAVIYPALL